MKPMILVTRYTDETTKAAAQRLSESARRFGLGCDVQGVSGDPGMRSRADFIQRMQNKWDSKRIVYLEATGLIRRVPAVFYENSFDVGAYVYRPAGGTPTRPGRFDGVGWIYPSTLVFDPTDRSRRVVERWIESNRAHPDRNEANNLLYFLAEEEIAFRYLPAEYCWIERIMRTTNPDAEPVVEHVASWIKGAPKILPWDESKPSVVYRSFAGLGDTFYARPAVKKLVEREGSISLVNPWPQVFWDMPKVKLLRPDSVGYRTQRKNMDELPPGAWAGTFRDGPSKLLEYTTADLRAGKTAIQGFVSAAGPVPSAVTGKDFRFNIPQAWIEDWMYDLPRPFAVVHPPTIRKEWPNPARNPRPEYIQKLVSDAPWVNWISVAWTEGSNEWFAGPPLKGIHKAFDKGELSTEKLMALVSIADFVLAGPCFLLPMAAALGRPVFTVFGGSVPPDCLVEPVMGDHVRTIAPDPFCACFTQDHACGKDIPVGRLVVEFGSFVKRLAL